MAAHLRRLGFPSVSRFARLTALCGVATAVYAMAVVWLPSGSWVEAVVSDTGVGVVAALACGSTLLAARLTRGVDRAAWALLAAGLGLWTVAEWIWWADEVVLRRDPFPSVADAFYLAGPPLLVSGMTMLGSQRRWHAQARALSEGMGISLAIGAVAWHFLMEPALGDASSGSTLDYAISAAYPATDIALLWVAITLAMRVGVRRDPSLFFGLVGGVAMIVLADSAFLYLDLNGGYKPGLTDAGWVGGYLLLATGAYTYVKSGVPSLRNGERPRTAAMPLHVLSILIATTMVGLLLFVGWTEGLRPHLVDVCLASGAIAIALMRQLIVIHDNLKLNRGLEAMRERLEAQVVELAAARDAANQANGAKSYFLSRMSHELRTPMNAVLGFGQLLQMEDLTHSQREHVGYIMSSGEHLLSLIDEVLDISRIEAGRMKVEIGPLHSADLIGEVMEMTAPIAAAAGIELHFARGGGADDVLADAQRLKQVLLNLISNAVKYNRPGGAVVVRTAVTDAGRMAISVADNGPGIAPELLGRVFNPFDRLNAESRGIQGTGLGLVLSKALVEAMHGSIKVDSVAGKGTRFTVLLPAARPRAEGGAALVAIEPLSILLIDSDNARRKLIERAMARRTGVQLLQASGLVDGVLMANGWPAAAIVIDASLGEPAAEFVAHLRRAASLNALSQVIVLGTGHAAEFAARWRPYGCDAWLPAPIDPEELIRVIETMGTARAA